MKNKLNLTIGRILFSAASVLAVICLLTLAAQETTAQRMVSTTPNPVLERKSIVTNAKGSDGKFYVKINLGISNYDKFGALFVRTADLPPCGENKNASRTWMRVFNAETGAEIFGYCAMTQSSDLQNFGFLIARENLPKGVFVVFEDRAGRRNYQSNCVNISDGKACNSTAKSILSKDINVWNSGTINTKVFSVLKPDLRINSFWMSADKNSFTVRIQNACKTAIKASFPVTLYIHEGKTVNTKTIYGETKQVQSLDGGFHTDVEFNISKIAKGKDIRGTHLINILLDSGNFVAEENENNNGFGVSSANQSLFPEAPCQQQ